MTMLKELAQLNETATPSKFYVVLVDQENHKEFKVISSIFSLFGYEHIGNADEFIDEEEKDSMNNHSTPVLTDFQVFAKRGLTSSSFEGDADLIKQLVHDIDYHDYIDAD